MLHRMMRMQKLLRDLTVMIEAEMPKAQAAMEKGEDWDFDRVTAELRKCAELDTELLEAIALETGDPSFGLSSRMSDEEIERAWNEAQGGA